MAERMFIEYPAGLFELGDPPPSGHATAQDAANDPAVLEARKERLMREALGGHRDDLGFMSSIGMIAIVLVTASALFGVAPREAREVVLTSYAAAGK